MENILSPMFLGILGTIVLVFAFIVNPWLHKKKIRRLLAIHSKDNDMSTFDSLQEKAKKWVEVSNNGKSFVFEFARNKFQFNQILSALSKDYDITQESCNINEVWNQYRLLLKLEKKLPWYKRLEGKSSQPIYLICSFCKINPTEFKKPSNFDINFGVTSISNSKVKGDFIDVLVEAALVSYEAEPDENINKALTKYILEKPDIVVNANEAKPYTLQINSLFKSIEFQSTTMDVSQYVDSNLIDYSYANVIVKDGENKYNVPMSVITTDFFFGLLKQEEKDNHIYSYGDVGLGKSGLIKILMANAEKNLPKDTAMVYLNVSELASINATDLKSALNNLKERGNFKNLLIFVDEADPILIGEGESTTELVAFILSMMSGVDHDIYKPTFVMVGNKDYSHINQAYQRRFKFHFSVSCLDKKQANDLFNYIVSSKKLKNSTPVKSELERILSVKTEFSPVGEIALCEIYTECFTNITSTELQDILKSHIVAS
jgi:hypothetical protein